MKLKKGFSLIEIGIVLVIIGILISAVMKGKDIMKNAEIKQHTQTYFSKWASVATTYYDKTGYNITGSSTDGSMGVADGRAEGNVSTVHGCTDLINYAEQAGINLSALIPTNTISPCRKIMSGAYSGDATVGVGFENLMITTQEENRSVRNIVLFFNVPGDIASAYDRLIDGVADSFAGKVVVLKASSSASATQITDNNLSDTNGTTAINADLNATYFHTVGVILEH